MDKITDKKKFAAFIMTYERPLILESTIKKLLEQTLPPEKILVIDNSDSSLTKDIIGKMDKRVAYFKVGYNAGPAGAAKIGLSTLAEEGYKWIYWGDDDDPPNTPDSFEKLISLSENYKGKCGQVGAVGHKINRLTGLIKRTEDKELLENEYLEVDNIGGNNCKIINAQAVLEGILPDEQLFFGFEELDFDLSLKKAGYKIIVHNEIFMKCRKMYGKLNYKKIISYKKNENVVWREYYSNRNLLYILKKNKYFFAVFFITVRLMLKSLYSFKHGISYGSTITKNTISAISDFRNNRFNQRMKVVSKFSNN